MRSASNISSPQVSIIIPNYNHGQYLGDAIASVFAQDFADFEIIIIDDGSTDNSREVAAQFTDPRLNYHWQENQGLSAARNSGLRLATGNYIGLLDADDMYEPHFLSKLVSALERQPQADGIYCGYQFVDDQNDLLFQKEARSVPSDQLYQALIGGNFLVPESILVHRYCYENVDPFDESLSACEDWDIWLQITKKYNIIGTKEILIRHRVLAGSMSSNPKRMLDNRLAVIEKHFGRAMPESKSLTSRHRLAYSRAYLTTAVEYLYDREFDQVYHCLLNMIKYQPELLTQPELYYELGCGNQPKGSRGDLKQLDIEHNSEIVLELLEKVSNDPNVTSLVAPYKQKMYATAFYVLGLLHFRTGRSTAARQFFKQTLQADPGYGLKRQFITTSVKAWSRPN